MYLIICPY